MYRKKEKNILFINTRYECEIFMFFVKKVVNYVFIFQKNPLLIFEIEIWKFKYSYHLHGKGSKVFVDKKGLGLSRNSLVLHLQMKLVKAQAKIKV